jgi:hypothetical protein
MISRSAELIYESGRHPNFSNASVVNEIDGDLFAIDFCYVDVQEAQAVNEDANLEMQFISRILLTRNEIALLAVRILDELEFKNKRKAGLNE